MICFRRTREGGSRRRKQRKKLYKLTSDRNSLNVYILSEKRLRHKWVSRTKKSIIQIMRSKSVTNRFILEKIQSQNHKNIKVNEGHSLICHLPADPPRRIEKQCESKQLRSHLNKLPTFSTASFTILPTHRPSGLRASRPAHRADLRTYTFILYSVGVHVC